MEEQTTPTPQQDSPITGADSIAENQPIASQVPLTPSISPVRRKKPIGAFIAAGVLVLLLAATAVYGYSKSSDKTSSITSQAAQTSVKTTPATTKDVDQTSKDIDAALQKADNTKDVSSADLTDTSLGL